MVHLIPEALRGRRRLHGAMALPCGGPSWPGDVTDVTWVNIPNLGWVLYNPLVFFFAWKITITSKICFTNINLWYGDMWILYICDVYIYIYIWMYLLYIFPIYICLYLYDFDLYLYVIYFIYCTCKLTILEYIYIYIYLFIYLFDIYIYIYLFDLIYIYIYLFMYLWYVF